MQVAIAGAHGKIAMLLAKRLLARNVGVIGLIRDPAHAEELIALGARPVLCDIEHSSAPEIAAVITGADAAVFAAGAGPDSGAERKLTVDRDGAIKLLAASAAADVRRYLIISSVGAEDPPDDDDVFSIYLRSKAEADAAVEASERDWTIIRPGRLTDDPGRGLVRIDRQPFRGEVPREDVAAVLDELLLSGQGIGEILYLNGGELPVEQAIEQAQRPR
jgi:nucleoside-diphosphate-sugar epimerase